MACKVYERIEKVVTSFCEAQNKQKVYYKLLVICCMTHKLHNKKLVNI